MNVTLNITINLDLEQTPDQDELHDVEQQIVDLMCKDYGILPSSVTVQPLVSNEAMDDEQNGPTLHNTIDNAAEQARLYHELHTTYSCQSTLTGSCDYFLVATIDGIEYYAANNEQWGTIIAVDHNSKLAVDTQFYEMDDMQYPDSDYAQVNHEGTLMCRWLSSWLSNEKQQDVWSLSS